MRFLRVSSCDNPCVAELVRLQSNCEPLGFCTLGSALLPRVPTLTSPSHPQTLHDVVADLPTTTDSNSSPPCSTMPHKWRNQHTGSRPAQTIPFTQPTITEGDVGKLRDIMKEKCGWDIKDFQLCALRALAGGMDVLVHAGTGYGKTAIFAGLHMLPATKGMMSIIASPLISLQTEQVRPGPIRQYALVRARVLPFWLE